MAVLWGLLACGGGGGAAAVDVMLSKHGCSPGHINFVQRLTQTHLTKVTQCTPFAHTFVHMLAFMLSFIAHIL